MLNGWFDPSSANALWAIFYLLAGSAVTLLGWVIKTRPQFKARITEAKLADDQIAVSQYKRVIEWCDRLDARVAALEREIEICHDERDAAKTERDAARAEVLKWKAVAEGVGTNRQDEAAEMARKRMEDRQRDD